MTPCLLIEIPCQQDRGLMCRHCSVTQGLCSESAWGLVALEAGDLCSRASAVRPLPSLGLSFLFST